MGNKWIRMDKAAAGGPRVFRSVDNVQDEVQNQLRQIQGGSFSTLPVAQLNELKKRKLANAVYV